VSVTTTPELFGTVSQGTRRGQSGLEKRYDDVLRGVDGVSRVTVDALGQLDAARGVSVTEPQPGQRLQLTLDYKLQRAGDAALGKATGASKYATRAGAWLAMDPRDGAILGMGSAPSFDAGVVVKPFSETTYRELTSRSQDAPLINRATESSYPTGSTFKPVTALAARDRSARRSGRAGPRRRLAHARVQGLPRLRRESRCAGRLDARALQMRGHRQAVDARRPRQPRGRPGRPPGDAAAARRRVRRPRRAAHPLAVVRRQGPHIPRGIERDALMYAY
jgi:transpeptidase family protein/penicillin-binding protein